MQGTGVIEPPAAAPPQWPVASLLTLSAAVFLSVTTEMLPTGLLPSMSRDLGVSPSTIGLLVTAYAIMVALFAVPLGMLTARFPRRTLLFGTLAGYAVSNTVMALSDAYPLAVLARLLGGATHGVFWAMLGGYAARMVGPDRVGRAITITAMGGTLAMLVGVPAGTALGVVLGWRGVFAVLAGLSLLLMLVGRGLLPDLPGRTAAAIRFGELTRIPGLAVIAGTTTVIMLGHFSFFTYIGPFLQHAGVTPAALGPALLGYGLTGAVGLALAGLVIDRRPRAVMLVSAAGLTAALIVLAVAGSATVLAVLVSSATGMALATLPIGLQAATLRAAPAAAEAASAVNASAFNIGIGGGALLGGVALDQWGTSGLPVIAALLTACGGIGIVLGRRAAFPRSTR